MSRKSLISLHLFLAAFFIPLVLLTAISGGLFLLDITGEVNKTVVLKSDSLSLDPKSDDIEKQIQDFFTIQHIDYQFEDVAGNSKTLVTRPTSRTYYVFNLQEEQVEVIRQEPNLIRTIVELHKGHGPKSFQLFQQVMSLGLVLILLSGFYLGISSDNLRRKTLSISGLGLLIMFLTILL